VGFLVRFLKAQKYRHYFISIGLLLRKKNKIFSRTLKIQDARYKIQVIRDKAQGGKAIGECQLLIVTRAVSLV
jgi:hypothetical protein